MAFDLIPTSFWNFPSFRVPSNFGEDEDDLQIGSVSPSGLSLSEDEKSVYVTAALPGVDEKNIDMTFDKGILWIKGEQEEIEENKKRKFYRKATGAFSYRIAVPGELDPTVEPDAGYKNGVMTIKFTKSPASLPKKISVKK